MKFTLENVLEALKEKLGKNTLLSPESLQSVENLMVFASEEMELSDFVDKVAPTFVRFNGQVNNDVSIQLKKKNVTPPSNQPSIDEIVEMTTKKVNEALAGSLSSIVDSIKTISEKVDETQKNRLVAETRSTLLKEASSIYDNGLIEISADSFDFSQEGASEKFTELLSKNAQRMGIAPKTPESEPKDKVVDTTRAKEIMDQRMGVEKK